MNPEERATVILDELFGIDGSMGSAEEKIANHIREAIQEEVGLLKQVIQSWNKEEMPMIKRYDYIRYDETAKSLQHGCKGHMHVLETFLNNLPHSREKSLAITKLEEAYMWIGKAIRDDQIARNGSSELQEERSDE